MKKNLLLLLFLLIIIQSNKAQQIGEGMAPVISNFNTGLLSGGYNGCTSYGLTGGVPDGSSVWQHLLTIRHPNSTNNYQLQLGATFEQNDRLFFRKIATGNNDGVSDWNEVATRGSNTFNGIQIFNNNVGIGTSTPQCKLDVNGRILTKELYILSDESSGGWGFTHLYWKGHSLIMGSPSGSYSHNAICFRPGGSSVSGQICENFLTIDRALSIDNYETCINFATNGNNNFIKYGNVGIGTTTPTAQLELADIYTAGGKNLLIGDDAYLTDVDIVNTLGLYSNSTQSEAGLQFGNNTGSLIYGINGNILIGKSTQKSSNYKLDVEGTIRANEIVVNTTGADFVFAPTYNLRPLREVESFIKANGHLPEVPKATDVQQNGVNLGEMQTKLLQKVEELTMYVIEMEKNIVALKQENVKLKEKVGLN